MPLLRIRDSIYILVGSYNKHIRIILMIKSIKPFAFMLCIFGMFLSSCNSKTPPSNIKISDDLQLIKINDYSYIHISKITLSNGAKFPCNGFIYTDKTAAYIFDSPLDNKATKQLIDWLQKDQKLEIKGVIFNHFHEDCTYGINIFKNKGIPTIASKRTATLLKNNSKIEPSIIFEDRFEVKLGNKQIINTFFGEGHTKDNIVSYFPDEEILFGGCLIKSLEASKGNLEDANILEWSNTVSTIKETYPNLKVIIPGHGDYGNIKLLDYTISLFKN